jgi:hypothetical protein
MLGNGLCTRPPELGCRTESACETRLTRSAGRFLLYQDLIGLPSPFAGRFLLLSVEDPPGGDDLGKQFLAW